MAYTYTADTLIYKDTETEQSDVQVWFTVPLKWAEEWCKEVRCESLKEFEETYTWDDSYEMYIAALEESQIIHMKEYDITCSMFKGMLDE